jgi:hypothetical protein
VRTVHGSGPIETIGATLHIVSSGVAMSIRERPICL